MRASLVVRNAVVWLSATIAGATYGRLLPSETLAPLAMGAILTAFAIYCWVVYATR